MTDIIKEIEEALGECVHDALVSKAHRAAAELLSVIVTIAPNEKAALEGLEAIHRDMQATIKERYAEAHDRKIN